MKNAFLHFKSNVPFELKINGECLNTVDNKSIDRIDILTSLQYLYITYTPISIDETYFPYTFILNNLDTITTLIDSVNIIPFSDNHYDIILNPITIDNPLNSTISYSKKLDQYIINIISNKTYSYLSILDNNCIIYNKQITKIENTYAKIENNKLLLEGESHNRIYFCLIDLSTKCAIFEKIVDSIKETKDSIKLLEKQNDLVGQGIIYSIDLKTNTVSNNVVYVNNNMPSSIKQTPLIPMAFLETIKCANFTQAKAYLDSSLQNVTNSHFTEYFNNFDSIYYNPYISTNTKVNYVIKNQNTYKSYNFILNNDKIKDIEQVF